MYETSHTSIANKTTYFIYNLIDKFIPKSKFKTFNLNIPSDTLYRTKLICDFIEDEIDEDFRLENFLMLIYLDFIKNAVKNYNPKSIYTLLNKSYYDTKTILLSDGNEIISIDRDPTDLSLLQITISRKDFEKGQLILDEIYELYKSRYSFSKLLECLWMDFIASYKTGENKRAYHSIIKILKECIQ